MKLKYDFDKDLLAAQHVERVFAQWLARNGMQDIEHAPKTEVFHDWDIKTTHDTYEIKYDRVFERTGNVLIETTSNTNTNSLGWFLHTKADWLIVFYNDTQFYGMPMQHLRDMWFNRPDIWTKKTVTQDAGYTTICWVAPITEFTVLRTGDVEKQL